MLGKTLILVLAIVTAAACTDTPDSGADGGSVETTDGPDTLVSVEAYPELVCGNASSCGVGWNDDEDGCREYFDSCLGSLTAAQRDHWVRQVDVCARNQSTCDGFWACYRLVPGC
jgi:hypothetical protein